MKDKDLYRIWAPSKHRWVDWVRPVCFLNIERLLVKSFELIDVHYVDNYQADMAIMIDLPAEESVLEGLSCAKLGYRPIALFNGTEAQAGSFAMVNQERIQQALVWGAPLLESLALSKEAAPVFLLDSNRILRFKQSMATYDNSWDLYNQDIPSPQMFLKHGINKILLRSFTLHRDLERIFYDFQKQGIQILYTNGFDEPQPIQIKKPPKKDKFH